MLWIRVHVDQELFLTLRIQTGYSFRGWCDLQRIQCVNFMVWSSGCAGFFSEKKCNLRKTWIRIYLKVRIRIQWIWIRNTATNRMKHSHLYFDSIPPIPINLGIRIRLRIQLRIQLFSSVAFKMTIKNYFFPEVFFLVTYPFEATFTSFFKVKKSQRSHKTEGIKVFLGIFDDDRRIRIRTYLVIMDPDPGGP